LRAIEIAGRHESFSAGDAIHIAVMEGHEIRSMLSFDSDFDRWPAISRIHQV
jgi:predicted nucleic acid-binding protein